MLVSFNLMLLQGNENLYLKHKLREHRTNRHVEPKFFYIYFILDFG